MTKATVVRTTAFTWAELSDAEKTQLHMAVLTDRDVRELPFAEKIEGLTKDPDGRLHAATAMAVEALTDNWYREKGWLPAHGAEEEPSHASEKS